MRILGRKTSLFTFAFVVVVAGLSACASTPPPAPQTAAAKAPGGGVLAPAAAAAPKLLDAADVRGLALATVSITSVDRFLTNGATLVAAAVPLPLDPAGVRDMLLSQTGLPPEVTVNLDFTAPLGAVVVPVGGTTGVVTAVAAKGAAEAARAIGALGKQVEKRGDFVLVDNGAGGRGWLWRDGAVVVFSDNLEALARGARLAEEARHAVAEDVTAVIFPDAIAKANGTDVKSAIALAIAQLKAQAGQAGGPPINDRSLESMTEMLSLIGDADPIELGLVADPAKGLSLRSRLHARTASRLEKIARESRPYELDTTLLGASKTPTLVAAWSIGAFMRSQMLHQREVLQASKAKGATGALAFVDALIAGIAGQASVSFGLAKEAPLFSGALAYPLKDTAMAAAVAGSLDRLDREAALAVVDAQVGTMPMLGWSFKKESVGKLKAVRLVATFKQDLGLDPKIAKQVFGKGIDVYMAVAGTRLLATFGSDAKANLGRIAVAKPVTPTGALADSLAATKGRDGFSHFDLTPILTLVGMFAKGKDPRADALARANPGPIPLITSLGGDGGGRVFSADLTIPPLAFKDAGAVVKAAMSGGGAPPPADAAPKAKGAGKAGKKK